MSLDDVVAHAPDRSGARFDSDILSKAFPAFDLNRIVVDDPIMGIAFNGAVGSVFAFLKTPARTTKRNEVLVVISGPDGDAMVVFNTALPESAEWVCL
jgi:hypothetical protein